MRLYRLSAERFGKYFKEVMVLVEYLLECRDDSLSAFRGNGWKLFGNIHSVDL